MQDIIIIDSDYEELELFSGDAIAPEVVAFAVGPKGEPGLRGDITPEATAALLEIRDARGEIVLSAGDARASKQAAALSEENARLFAESAGDDATQAMASELAAADSEFRAAESEQNAAQANVQVQAARIEILNARDQVVADKGLVSTARDQAQTASNDAATALGETVTARNAAQTARADAIAARNTAQTHAANALQSAQNAATFDPAQFVSRASNGSTFADPAQVRVNIGAQAALAAVTLAEITAGVSLEARLWSADAVRRAAEHFAGQVTHDISQINGLGTALSDLDTDISSLQTQISTKASANSPVLTGTPTAPTAALTTDNDQLATTSFVWNVYRQLTDGADQAFDTFREIQDWIEQHGQDAADIVTQLGTKANINHTHAILDITGLRGELDALTTGLGLRAPLASPALTGSPTAPTQPATDNSTKIATTAQVQAAIAAAGLASEGHTHVAADITDLQTLLDAKANSSHNHTIAQVTNLQTSLDAKAPLASPAFTGNPTASTQATGNNSTRLATTAFVATAVANMGATKANSTHGHAIGDVTNLQTSLDAKAPLASPALTGNPTAPTQAQSDNSTRVATTAFVKGGLAEKLSLTGGTLTGELILAASTASIVPIVIPHGLVPTATAAGDLWSTTSGLFMNINGAVNAFWTDVNMAAVAQAEAEAGTATVARAWTAQRVRQSIAAYALPLTGGALSGALSVAGDVNVTGNIVASGNVTGFSDARLKSDVETIEDALDLVMRMRGVRYTMNGERSMGVIAQEMLPVAPELVRQPSSESDMLAVAYGNTVGVLIEAIKALKAEVDELRKEAA